MELCHSLHIGLLSTGPFPSSGNYRRCLEKAAQTGRIVSRELEMDKLNPSFSVGFQKDPTDGIKSASPAFVDCCLSFKATRTRGFVNLVGCLHRVVLDSKAQGLRVAWFPQVKVKAHWWSGAEVSLHCQHAVDKHRLLSADKQQPWNVIFQWCRSGTFLLH